MITVDCTGSSYRQPVGIIIRAEQLTFVRRDAAILGKGIMPARLEQLSRSGANRGMSLAKNERVDSWAGFSIGQVCRSSSGRSLIKWALKIGLSELLARMLAQLDAGMIQVEESTKVFNHQCRHSARATFLPVWPLYLFCTASVIVICF